VTGSSGLSSSAPAAKAPPHASEEPDGSAGSEYRLRLAGRSREAERWRRLDGRLSNARLIVFALGVAQGFATFGTHHLAAGWLAPTIVIFVGLLVAHDRVIQARRRAERSISFFERGLARLEDRWIGTGNQRSRDGSLPHTYSEDLDIFGPGSLFELLCTARTPAGEEMLAGWLLAPADPDTIRARQAAVEELRERLDLREDLSLLGDDVRSQLDPAALIEWGQTAGERIGSAPRLVAVSATGLSLLALAAAIFTGAGLFPFLFALLLQMGVAYALRSRVRRGIRSAAGATRDLALLRDLLARLESEPASSPRLVALRQALDSEGLPPSRRIAQLRRTVDLLDARQNQFFAPFGALLMWGTHFGLAAENWRAHHGPALARWIAAAAEIEALGSLASYAYEHPDDPFPEIVGDGAPLSNAAPLSNGAPLFEGRALGHPLLPGAECVRNSVALSGERQAYMVSGSNMSGKSTLLRTVGVNVVMALAGAPVRAESVRLSPLTIGASIHVVDSLQEGTSHFYAEIKRIRQVMDLTEGPLPVLFLLDEVLHGTNSHDRRIGAEAVLRGLLERRAIGFITTHDLALAKLAEDLSPQVENVHFQDQLEDGQMHFDYRLWPGVVTRSNALELMRAIGLEV
jgi:hypothetical protein